MWKIFKPFVYNADEARSAANIKLGTGQVFKSILNDINYTSECGKFDTRYLFNLKHNMDFKMRIIKKLENRGFLVQADLMNSNTIHISWR